MSQQYQLPDGSYLSGDSSARQEAGPDGAYINQASSAIASPAAGTASGSGSASGVGVSARPRIGTATGSGAAVATRLVRAATIGAASGTGSAAAVPTIPHLVPAAGTARGHGSAVAISPFARLGSMDTVFLNWARRDNAQRVVLVELDFIYELSGVPTTGTLYMATKFYIDEENVIRYRECINTVANFQRSLTGPTLGTYQSSFGTIEIDNANHEFDDILKLAIDNSEVRVYMGDLTWTRSDFRLMFSAMSVKASATQQDRISVTLKDASTLLDKSIGGSVLIGGTGTNAQQFRAANFGYVHQAPCQLIDAATLLYSHSDRGDNVYAPAAYDRGIPVSFNDNGDGTINLLASPEGQVTADVIAVNPTSPPGDYSQRKVSDAFRQYVYDRGGLGVAGRYSGAGPTFAVGDDDDYPVGISITSATNLTQTLLPALAQTGNCFWSFLRTGEFTFGRLDPNNIAGFGLTPISINYDDIVNKTLKEDKLALPTYYRLQAVFNKNWFVATDVAAAVDPDTQASLRNTGLVLQQEDSVGTTYADSPELYDLSLVTSPVIETWVSSNPEDVDPITDVGDRWMEKQRFLYLPWLQGISFTTGIEFFELELGDVVLLMLPWFDCQSGQLFQVVSVNLKPDKGQVELTLMRRRTSESIPPDFTRTTMSMLDIRVATGTPPNNPNHPPTPPSPPTTPPSIFATPHLFGSFPYAVSATNPYVDRLQFTHNQYVTIAPIQTFGANYTHSVAITYDAAYMVVGVPTDISGGGHTNGVGSGLVHILKRQPDATYLEVATITRPSSDATTGTDSWGEVVDINDELDIFVGTTGISAAGTNHSNARIYTYTGGDTWDTGTDLGFSSCSFAHFSKWNAAGSWSTTKQLVVYEGQIGSSSVSHTDHVHVWRNGGSSWVDQQTITPTVQEPSPGVGSVNGAVDVAVTFDGRSIAVLYSCFNGTDNAAYVELWQTNDSLLWNSVQSFQIGPTDREDGGPIDANHDMCIAMSFDTRVIAVSNTFGVSRSGTLYGGVYIFRAEGTVLWPIVGAYSQTGLLLGDDTTSTSAIALSMDGQFLLVGQNTTTTSANEDGALFGINRIQSLVGEANLVGYAHAYQFANPYAGTVGAFFGRAVAMDINGRRCVSAAVPTLVSHGTTVTEFENRLDDLIAGITNDDFASAFDFTPGIFVVDGLLSATKPMAASVERGETISSVGSGQPVTTLWYKIAPLVDILFSIDALLSTTPLDPFFPAEYPASSSIDTVLVIFTGSSVDTLTEVVGNDDAAIGGTLLSSLPNVFLTGGSTYYIRIQPYIVGGGVDFPLLKLRYSYLSSMFLHDTFTDTNGTDGATHTPEIGGGWFAGQQDDFANANPIIESNALSVFGEPGSFRALFSNTAPTSSDYALQVSADVGPDNGFHASVLFARVTNATATGERTQGYIVQLSFDLGLGWRIVLYKQDSGAVQTNLATFVPTVVAGSTHTLRFELLGDSLIVKYDGATVISVTDSTYGAPGSVGCLVWGDFTQTINEITGTYIA